MTTLRNSKSIADYANLSSEWDEGRNGIAASAVTIGSNKTFWWKCAFGHAFEGKPNNRSSQLSKSGRITRCPECYRGTFTEWNWDTIVKVVTRIRGENGYLPPATWFRENGYAALIGAVYRCGKTWTDVRLAVDSFENSATNPSRCGIRWRSKAEACLSDFLYAREIEHTKGRKYAPSYAKASGKAYGVYDLRFRVPDSETWIDVEVWGGDPVGRTKEEYRQTRSAKSRYNFGNPNFVGIEHSDCYSDSRLTRKLSALIGVREPTRFDHELDRIVPTSHWSTYEEVLALCKQIAANQPDGILPGESWLSKRRFHKDREGEAYPSLPDAITKHFGSLSNVRRILGQGEHNQTRWSKDLVLRELSEWMKRYGRTPWVVRGMYKRGVGGISESEFRRASTLTTMAHKYCDSMTKALSELGYSTKPPRPKSTSLELLHRAVQQITEIAREDLSAANATKVRLLTKKIYLYARRLDDSVSERDESASHK